MDRNKLKKRDEKIIREYLRKLSRKVAPNRFEATKELAGKYDMSAEGIRGVLIRHGVYKSDLEPIANG